MTDTDEEDFSVGASAVLIEPAVTAVDSSDEEDFTVGRDGGDEQPAIHAIHGASSHVEAEPPIVPAPVFKRGRGRYPKPKPKPEASGGLDAQPDKLAQAMFGAPAIGAFKLYGHAMLAKMTGKSRWTVARHTVAFAHAAYDKILKLSESVVVCIEAMKRTCIDRHSAKGIVIPAVQFRCRKYDSTSTKKLNVVIESRQIADDSSGELPLVSLREKWLVRKPKVFVTEASQAFLLRNLRENAERFSLHRRLHPCLLQSMARGTGDFIFTALGKQLFELPQYKLASETFVRTVDIVTDDDDTANLRNQRAIYARDAVPAVRTACRAHKMMAQTKLTFAVVDPFDTHCIRLVIALEREPYGFCNLGGNCEDIMEEQLTIIHPNAVSVEEHAQRNKLYNRLCTRRTKKERYREGIIRRLWNGRICKRGFIEHLEDGCCKSPAETLRLMKTVGRRSLVRKLRIFMRGNWANTGETLRLIALPTAVHGILPQALLRTLKYSMKV